MQVPIRVYYHVTMINDFIDITKYIFDKVVSSGLMDECDGLFIGALGDESELEKLKELVSKYAKAKIVDYHSDKARWEFHTMQHMKKDADTLPKFYAWYLHSKSVTKTDPNEKLYGKFWSDYMINEVVVRWKQCYAALDMPDIGYDICGTRMIPKRKSASIFSHASGNMWAANSEYIKTLPKIGENDDVPNIESELIRLRKEMDELTKKGELKVVGNVFYPEMWAWEGQPLTYIACNAFTVGFPFQKTFEQTINEGYEIQKYRTNP